MRLARAGNKFCYEVLISSDTIRAMKRLSLAWLGPITLWLTCSVSASAATLGISGDKFTIDGQARFLLGVSYFDWKGWRAADLDGLRDRQFNLIRIILDLMPELWDPSFTTPRDRSAFNADGSLRDAEHLLNLVRAANQRGIIVDVTVFVPESGGYIEAGIRNIMRLRKDEVNVFYDLVNEHVGLGQGTYWSEPHSTMQWLIAVARSENPSAIVTYSSHDYVSNGHIISSAETARGSVISEEISTGIHVLTPHFRRDPNWYDLTDQRVAAVKGYLQSIGVVMPIYLQEEARVQPETNMFPTADNFLQAAREARNTGAAGWVLHTAAGFDLRYSRWFERL
jgi:hypothetical protein